MVVDDVGSIGYCVVSKGHRQRFGGEAIGAEVVERDNEVNSIE